jgi:hypothetical protein
MLVILALVIALAVLAPLFGADTRDGLDWTPGHFWLRHRPAPRGRRRHRSDEHHPVPDHHPGDRSSPAAADVRTPGSPARTSAVPCGADRRRTVPAAG